MRVLGLGTAVPPHTMSQAEALEMSTEIICRDERQRRLLKVLFRQSGIENRHTVIPHRMAVEWSERGRADADESGREWHGPGTSERMALYGQLGRELAENAGRRTLENGRVDPASITHLVTVSCTGFDAPGIDVHLMRTLGLPPTTERVNVGFMGCHGAINGLRVGRGLGLANRSASVLVCAMECCSLHYRLAWDEERVIGNALFADGAAGMVLRSEDAVDAEPKVEGGTTSGWSLRGTGSCLIPGTEDLMGWQIGDNGFEMRLTSRVADAIERHVRPWLDGWLEEYGLSSSDVAHWGVHPGGPRILDAVEEALGLNDGATDVSRRVLADYGNMSSPTVLFVLERLGPPRGPCVLLGFGPGLVAEAALLLPA